MGLFTVDLFSSLIAAHMLYKTALIITVVRWILCWAFRVRNRTILFSSSSSSSSSSNNGNDHNLLDTEYPPFPSSYSAQKVADSLLLTSFREITKRLPKVCCWDTCAVCLSQLNMEDEVRELRNCCHVFHRECIDRWLDHRHHHDNHNSCPICRAPLVTSFQSQSLSSCNRSQPSWAVERLLYLFGDDLIL